MIVTWQTIVAGLIGLGGVGALVAGCLAMLRCPSCERLRCPRWCFWRSL